MPSIVRFFRPCDSLHCGVDRLELSPLAEFCAKFRTEGSFWKPQRGSAWPDNLPQSRRTWQSIGVICASSFPDSFLYPLTSKPLLLTIVRCRQECSPSISCPSTSQTARRFVPF